MTATDLTIAIYDQPTGWSIPDRYINQITQAAAEHMPVRQVTSHAALNAALPQTAYLLGFPLTEEQVNQHVSHLQWIQLTGSTSGTTGPVRAALRGGARVTSSDAFRAPQLAEHTLALVLALTRRLDASFRAQIEHRWDTGRISTYVRDLRESSVLLVSAGSIATHMLTLLRAAGAAVTLIGSRLSSEMPEGVRIAPREQLDAELAQADIIILALPTSSGAADMIGRKQFDKLRSSALFINVSRAGVVDERALLDALRRGRLAGAGLDVFAEEPLPESSAFWTMPNVIVTPHVGAASPSFWKRATEVICTNIQLLVQGEAMVDEIDADVYAPASAR